MKKPCGQSFPIIYSPEYNISVLGIENFHPFDTKKYKRVVRYLRKKVGICKEQFLLPIPVSQAELLTVHSAEYLHSLRKSRNIARIAELPPLSIIPNVFLRRGLLKPMLYGTGGTIMGLKKALEYGWAINLSGGYHHAKANSGEGFCFFC